MKTKNTHSILVLFVEGETEKEFYEALLIFYRKKYKICRCKVINVKGISRFESKVSARLKFEIIPKHPESIIKVVCCYDTDVFELAQKPPTNWSIVKKKVNELGIDFFDEVKAIRMIEDWFLNDIEGLCKYLNIEVPSKLDGKTGLDKIKTLFKKGTKPKVYQKGNGTHKFIALLNIGEIRNAIKKELRPLEIALEIPDENEE